MATKIILLALLGGFLSLDRVFAQVMISRPIVTAPLVGLVLGELYLGLQAGAVLELFWIDRLAIGTVMPPNDFLVAFLVTSASILAGQNLNISPVPQELLTFSALLFIPCGILGQTMDRLIIKSNDANHDAIMNDAQNGNIQGISRRHLTGLAKNFLVHFCLILVLLLAGQQLLVHLYPLLPQPVLHALHLTFLWFILLGLAACLNTIHLKGAIPLFCAIFLLVALLLESVHVF